MLEIYLKIKHNEYIFIYSVKKTHDPFVLSDLIWDRWDLNEIIGPNLRMNNYYRVSYSSSSIIEAHSFIHLEL